MASPFGIDPTAGSGNGPSVIYTGRASRPITANGPYGDQQDADQGADSTPGIPMPRRSYTMNPATREMAPNNGSYSLPRFGIDPTAGSGNGPSVIYQDRDRAPVTADGPYGSQAAGTQAGGDQTPGYPMPYGYSRSRARAPRPADDQFLPMTQRPPPIERQNFLNSVAQNNGNQLPYPGVAQPPPSSAPTPDQISASTFARAKAGGVNDAAARREAYIASHGGASAYGTPAMSPVGPSVNGASATPAATPQVGTKGENTEYSRANAYYQSRVNQATAKLTALQNQINSLPPEQRAARAGDMTAAQKALDDAYAEQQKFRQGSITGFSLPRADGTDAPTPSPGLVPGTPSAPGTDTPSPSPQLMPSGFGAAATPQAQTNPGALPYGAASAPEQPAGTKKDINLTTQQLRAMWNVALKTNPGLSDRDLQTKLMPTFSQHVASEYGIPVQDVQRVMGNWAEQGTFNQGELPRVVGTQPAAPQAVVPMTPGAGGIYDTAQGRVIVDANGRRVGNFLPGHAPLPPDPVIEMGPEQGYTPIMPNRPPRATTPTLAASPNAAPAPAPPAQTSSENGAKQPTRQLAASAVRKFGSPAAAIKHLESKGYDVSGYAD